MDSETLSPFRPVVIPTFNQIVIPTFNQIVKRVL